MNWSFIVLAHYLLLFLLIKYTCLPFAPGRFHFHVSNMAKERANNVGTRTIFFESKCMVFGLMLESYESYGPKSVFWYSHGRYRIVASILPVHIYSAHDLDGTGGILGDYRKEKVLRTAWVGRGRGEWKECGRSIQRRNMLEEERGKKRIIPFFFHIPFSRRGKCDLRCPGDERTRCGAYGFISKRKHELSTLLLGVPNIHLSSP